MRPLTYRMPKSMLPVGGRPLLELLIELVKKHNVQEVAINLYHLPQAITSYFGDGSSLGVKITYSYEETLLGSAGGVKKIASFFDQPSFIIYGDVLTNMDLTDLARFHREQKGLVTMGVYKVKDPARCGIVEMDEQNRITGFIEKPKPEEVESSWANAGVYVIEPAVLDFIPSGQFYDFGSDLFPKLIKKNVFMYGYRVTDYLIDIGTPKNYAQAQRDMGQGKVAL